MKRFSFFVHITILVSVLLLLSSFSQSSYAEPLFTGCNAVIVDVINADWEQEVLDRVNDTRADNGLSPLKLNTDLSNAARYHMVDMEQDDYFEHDSYDRVNGALQQVCAWYSRLTKFYQGGTLGENIAWGYPDPASVMDGWMNSTGHRANILSTHYRELGVGYNNRYWGQDFGARSGVYPLIISRDAKQAESPNVQLYIYDNSWTEMRLHNDDDAWGEWQPFQSELQWTLSPLAGMRTVSVEMRNSTKSASSSDTIELLLLETPTDTPQPTATHTPTNIPQPTATDTSTATPVPTTQPTPTFTPTEELQPPALLGKVTFQGHANAPNASWRQPLQVDFAPMDQSNQSHSYAPVTDDNGYFAIRDLPLGAFSIAIQDAHSLRRVVETTLDNAINQIDAGELIEGEIVPDHQINIFDFSLLAKYYTHCIGNSTFLATSDLNDDLCIDDSDFNLLHSNFGMVSDPWSGGDLSAAAVMLDSANPPLEIAQISQQKAGDQVMVTLRLAGQSSNLINAGAVYLNFDPTQLKAVNIRPAAPFDIALVTHVDNEKGEADIAVGMFGPGVQAPTAVASVIFEALVDVDVTSVSLAFDGERRSDFAGDGQSRLLDPLNSDLQATGEASAVDHSVFLPLLVR